jgi:hypothetical protein
MRSSRLCWIGVCAAGLLLAGCDDGPSANAPTSAAGAAKPAKPAATPLPPEMVAAVSSAKNSSVVSVHFVLKGIPTVSKALPVDIAIIPHESMSAVVAHFEARDGLAMATGNVLDRQADPTPEKVITHQLILLPGKEGVFMVTAIIETETSEGAVSRIYSIPVIVGPPGAAPAETPPAPPATPPANG